MVKSSEKGARWEREVARELSLWLTDGQDDTQLWRSTQSGGWSNRDEKQVGDLQANGVVGKEFRDIFSVECKHRKEIDFYHVFSQSDPDILVWWHKHVQECLEYSLCPLLIMKRNYYPVLIGAHKEIFNKFLEDLDETITINRRLMFVELEEFLNLDVDRVKQTAKAIYK